MTSSEPDLDDVVEAIAAYEEKTNPALKGLDVKTVRRWLDRELNLADRHVCIQPDPAGPPSFVVWRSLAFDSDIYGFPMGRIDYWIGKSPALEQALAEAQARGMRHLHYRVSADDFYHVHRAEDLGFRVMATFAGLLCKLGDPGSLAAWPGEIRLLAPSDDIGILQGIARHAFDGGTRFHADPVLSREGTVRLYDRWVANSCSGQVADAVLVATDGDKITGFITCSVSISAQAGLVRTLGSIGLLAVGRPFQGRGISRRLLQAALAWFSAHQVGLVEVGTESMNYAALNAYISGGFRPAWSAYSLHLSLTPGLEGDE